MLRNLLIELRRPGACRVQHSATLGYLPYQVMTMEKSYNLNICPFLRLWHPNISEEGEICLSLLRPHSVDGLGWAPTRLYFPLKATAVILVGYSRRLRDVLWGLSSLFSDLLNFEDPLNIEAAEHFRSDQEAFRTKVRDWVVKYAKR